MIEYSPALRSILRCPACAGSLADDAGGAFTCSGCGTVYGRAAQPGEPVDLRLHSPKAVARTFQVGETPLSDSEVAIVPLRRSSLPQVDFSGIDAPNHLTPEILSHFPAGGAGAMALDLGCGWGVHRSVVERAGFEWVGIDYGEIGAPMLADAHALPFADDSFEFLLSIAVLEHLRYPFVAMAEALRVMRPGSTTIGTVAFLEPCHGDSHYHHTHLGTLNTLRHAGFDVVAIAPHADWMVLRAQAEMGLYPSLSDRTRRTLTRVVQVIHERSWRRANGDESQRLRNTTGAFTFIARKPASA